MNYPFSQSNAYSMKKINQRNLRGIFLSIALLTTLLIHCSYSWAQNSRTISGVVKDAKGLPLSGASVVVKGTANGTATNTGGKFSLSVPGSNVVLVISFAGYQNKEITVKNLTT